LRVLAPLLILILRLSIGSIAYAAKEKTAALETGKAATIPAYALTAGSADLLPPLVPLIDSHSLTTNTRSVSLIIKGSVSASVQKRAAQLKALKHVSDHELYDEANEALQGGDFDLALKDYQKLTTLRPKEPLYFYGAGLACRAKGDNPNAFSNFMIAKHLGYASLYDGLIDKDLNSIIPDMQKQIDSKWKITYGFKPQDSEYLLNAGARCFKVGFWQASTQLFEYVLNHDSLYRHVAAYNLGAMCEYAGALKEARTFYVYAQKAAIEVEGLSNSLRASRDFRQEMQVRRSLEIVSPALAGGAVNSINQKLLAHDRAWRGWEVASRLPKFWVSEICPNCAINRFKKTYP
jgi:tetratricopeptide (TPR) repeat protein